jgi:hypothetical protein
MTGYFQVVVVGRQRFHARRRFFLAPPPAEEKHADQSANRKNEKNDQGDSTVVHRGYRVSCMG